MPLKNLNRQKFLNKVKSNPRVLFIFDYDGTLTPIVPVPNDAILNQKSKNTLNQLADMPNTKVAILTGRSLKNLKELLGEGLSPNIMLLGSHGAEIGQEASANEYTPYLNEIKEKYSLNPLLDLEEKTLSIAIHYKRYPDPDEIKKILYEESKNYKDLFRVQEGHKVFEFLPKDINKGKAMGYFHEKFPDFYLVFFGDDLTDNHGFLAIKELGGLSIQVDDRIKDPAAEFFIPSVENVYELIEAYIN